MVVIAWVYCCRNFCRHLDTKTANSASIKLQQSTKTRQNSLFRRRERNEKKSKKGFAGLRLVKFSHEKRANPCETAGRLDSVGSVDSVGK
tara:strand:- start:1 stop:270 length:270 start_codon:yes stop_codon:yes gene_type:complete